MERRGRAERFFFCRMVMVMVIFSFILCGCTALLDSRFSRSLPPADGIREMPGISTPVNISRDELGIPFVEAGSLEDLVLAMGYVSAWDRFSQMEGFRLVGQGRLAEMIGPAALEMDMYLRALDVNRAARALYDSASPELLHLLQRYSDGVNAYLDQAPLPATLKLSGHKPEPWRPIDSVSVFIVLTLGLAQNLHEEIGILNLAQKIDPEEIAWLIPIYPDEPLPFEEMNKLADLDLAPAASDLAGIHATIADLNRLIVPAAAASNNWAVSGSRTASGRPIMANDTHLPLSMPSYWHMMKLKCPGLEGAGVALAGVPGIIAGYNGHMGVGMTMVMADNQDVFLEKLRRQEDGLYYLYQGQWRKTDTRQETIKVKGKKDEVITVYETGHGPLLNNILTGQPRHMLMPVPSRTSLGIAVSWAAFEPDQSMELFFNIMKATSVDEILSHTGPASSIIPLNLVMADENDIAWQVIGRFPIRKKGRGLCPSPGWTGAYDWQGFLDPSLHPVVKNPDKGYVGTANNRTVPADHPQILSSSWHYPDRARRINQMIEAADPYTRETAKAMQQDTRSLFVEVIQEALLDETTAGRMAVVWEKDRDRQRAEAALDLLAGFDGDMRVDSAAAAFCGAFLHCLSINLFADECGGTDTPAWKALVATFQMAYSTLHDHLMERGKDSPFWNDVTTAEVEERHHILAASVLDAVELLEKRCGKSPQQWRWGDLHQYEWVTEATRFAPHMGFFDKMGMKLLLSGYLDRGPYPAPGDHTTLNVAAASPGKDFDVWLVPAMRIIVDFGAAEPLIGINSSGQSDNPASPCYDKGVEAWLKGEYNTFPFREENIRQHYHGDLVLIPGS